MSKEHPKENKGKHLLLIIVIILGLLIRCGILFKDLGTIDRLFIPDDTYYTLAIARNMADGTGPSVDGVTLTNGFQPLFAFQLIPVFLISDDIDVPIRAALLLSLLYGVAGALLLARILNRIIGATGAVVGAALWSLSPIAIANDFVGLETSMAVTLCFALVETWCWARTTPSLSRFIWPGIIAGLVLLARVDTVFLVVLFGLAEFVWGNRKGVLIAAVCALVVVAPWWIYSTVNFGSPIPESGSAVKEQAALHQSLYLDVDGQIAWSVGSIIGSPFLEVKKLKEWVFAHSSVGIIVGILFAAFMVIIARQIPWKSLYGLPFFVLCLYGALILLFYTFYLPALWFFRRYLHPSHAVIALLFALLVALLKRDSPKSAMTVIVYSAIAILIMLSVYQSVSYIWASPPQTGDILLHGTRGYRDVSYDVLRMVPEGSVIGAFQSGALAYYAGKQHTVVNLDGVVDGRAADAIRQRRLGAYARSRGVAFFADWKFNCDALIKFGGQDVAQAEFQYIGSARPQGPERTLVFMVNWK